MKKAQPANFPEFEKEMLAIWQQEQTFERSLENRRDAKRFSFYDGPPFANGLPHYGHVVALTEKDAITRYKTMRGYFVPRRNGWDTHGLPVEFEVEKQLGISGKRQILDMGIAKFNQAARDNVFKYKNEWEEFMTRLGRWSDQENSYATLDDNYIESVWWVMSELHKKDLVYRGFRSNPYCPRCATPLSNFEVNQNYKDDTPDPSVFVKFSLKDHENTSLLAWTTTPWTLPANAALAVAHDALYATIEFTSDGDSWKAGERLILAKGRLSELDLRKAEYKVVEEQKGDGLVGLRYEPLYTFATVSEKEQESAWRVYADASVSLEDGSGVLHVAPRYGETDLDLGLRVGLPLIESVDNFGRMSPKMGEFAGQFFKEADPEIIADLTEKGHIFAAETFTHTYPFCWRCETPLMYFAMPSWFVKASSLRQQMVDTNNQVNWVPDHIKQGRFGNWLAEARDWNFSRNRFWGAPIPIWQNVEDEDDIIVVSSLDELRKLSGHDGDFDLHRPGIDQVEITTDGKTYKRVEEVFDCWFESGSMPYAQDHYPFDRADDFKDAFPAEFIAEGLDQTRGWFYTLHVLGTALFDAPAYKNVIVNGLVLAADGKKLSKRLRNYPDPAEIFESYGADALRFFLMSSPVVGGEDVRFSGDAVQEVSRNVFARLWNVYSFFSTYAEIDVWMPTKTLKRPMSHNVLDAWLLARLDEVIAETTKQADAYTIAKAVRPLRELVDDVSNWYVRRSRRRFWKSDDDGDKQAAYATLHYTLVRISQLLAPWSPFVADKLWRELTADMDLPASVHISDWPETTEVDRDVLAHMAELRDAITGALAVRAEAGIKVRQPLSSATVSGFSGDPQLFTEIVQEELNVKMVKFTAGGKRVEIAIDTTLTPELTREGMMRDVVRHIQSFRKTAGLAVEDRIKLKLDASDAELKKALDEHGKTIAAETLATFVDDLDFAHETTVKVSGSELKVSIHKA